MKRHLFIILIWLWLTMALLALFIRQVPPFQFIDSSALVLFIESSKLFFIIILFPLIINNSCHEDTKTPKTLSVLVPWWLSFLDYLKLFAIFILLSLPLTIMASYLGDVNPGILLRANLLLLLIAGFISLLSFRHSLIYYLAVFLLFGVGPIMYYLILELTGASWSFLFLINPFWLFWNMTNAQVFSATGGSASGGNPAWLVQCLIWVALIIVVVTIYRIIKKTA